ncbi:hypothetical protein ACFV1C_36890 [Streptomyces sp. NPDC059605]|uniref:hypothetical protein n=1 Tax=unclassified Streptomyces TaxID=2593676 RepID=UPI0036A56D45
MGLNMIVGVPAHAEDGRTGTARADLAVIAELLERAGAQQWTGPGPGEVRSTDFEMWGYSGLHAVRRLAVHLAADGRLPEPLDEGRRATDDPLLTEVYRSVPGDPPGPFDHLIHHSDCEGYYVPVDFARVIVDEKAPGGHLGSSVRLLAEVRRIAEAIGLPEDIDPDSEEVVDAADAEDPDAEGWRRYGVESHDCLRLLEAAKLSVETGAAIAFS